MSLSGGAYEKIWNFDQFTLLLQSEASRYFHLLANLAGGGILPENLNGSTTFLQEMKVDHIRFH
jgi:hypothetical protein